MSKDMDEFPLISIIVPVYNGQDYIASCVESIEKQTYKNFEVIIINDGSTDKTEEICEQLAQNFANIRIITMNDEGVSEARNAGLYVAKGEYITFVDADDRIRVDMIKTLYDCLRETQSDVVGCGFISWSEETQWEKIEDEGQKLQEENKVKVYTAEEFLEQEILNGNSRCWSKLYNRNIIGGLKFRKDITIGEDMLFLVDLLSSISQVAEIPYKGYGYYQNPEGAMKRAFLPEYMDQIICWEIAREEIVKMNTKLKAKVTSILLTAIILTAGKIAMLSRRDRKRQKQYMDICHEKLSKEIHVLGAYEKLSVGYKVKVKLFCIAPSFYLWLYHFRKYKKNIVT